MGGHGVAAPRWVVALSVVALALLGCTSGDGDEPADPSDVEPIETAPTTPSGGTLRIGLPADPATLDPRFVGDDEGELLVGALFEPLLRVDVRGRPTPGAARSWEISEDGTVFTFALREATFHDGTPVTAADFVRSFARIADLEAEPPSPLSFLLEPIEGSAAAADGDGLSGVEALDERTLRITVDEPAPRFLLTLADPSLVPVPEAADEDEASFATAPIGNGPFALAEEPEPGAFVRMTRFDDHHRRPFLDEVVFQVYPDDPARDRQWADLEDGLLQVADVGAEHRDEAVERYGTSTDGRTGPGVLDGTTATVYLLGFDLTRPPFDDEAVRRAISQSIDREALADEVFAGSRQPADRIVPPGIAGSQSGACDHCRTDPEGAAALLADAEVDLGDEPLVFTFNTSGVHEAVGEAVAGDVAEALDVAVEIEDLDLDEFVLTVRRGDAPWFRLGWDVNAPDPGAYLEPLFHSRNVGLDNLTRYADEETDELLDQARAAPTIAESQAAYRAAEQRILDAVAVVPLLLEEEAKVVTPGVEGLIWDATGRVDLARVRLVDID